MSKIQVYYPELIINFYKKIKFSSFKNLTSERAQEIDDLVPSFTLVKAKNHHLAQYL